MKVVDKPTLTLRHRDGSDPPVSEIVLNDRATGKTVQGAVLEGAVKADDLYLIFTTDDTPIEEILWVHLTDDVGNTIESLWIGGAYSTGAFEQLQIISSDSVRFRFIGDTDWIVCITPSPRFRIPIFTDPRGVSRPLKFWSRLVVKGRPKPEMR